MKAATTAAAAKAATATAAATAADVGRRRSRLHGEGPPPLAEAARTLFARGRASFTTTLRLDRLAIKPLMAD